MPLLHINNLHLAMRSYEGEAHVLNGVELQVDKGEIWGLAGETGCGKSVTGLSVSRLVNTPPARYMQGRILFDGQDVLAARALGAGPVRILWRHILPNIVSPVIVKMSLDVGFAVLTVASLGFVGIGVKPPTPEWGQMLSTARGFLPDYWWTAIFPGAAIFVAVLSFNLLGDGLRDVLDPKSRR